MSDALVLDNLNLVHFVCHKYFGNRLKLFDYEDLAGYGNIGLLKAAKRFDPERNVRFSTYAVPYIYAEIAKYVRDTNPGGIKLTRKQNEEGFTVPCAYFQSPSQEEGPLIQELVGGEQDFTELHVKEFLSMLSGKERGICEGKITGMTQRQIAETIGVGQSQVSRSIKTIAIKLREYLKGGREEWIA